MDTTVSTPASTPLPIKQSSFDSARSTLNSAGSFARVLVKTIPMGVGSEGTNMTGSMEEANYTFFSTFNQPSAIADSVGVTINKIYKHDDYNDRYFISKNIGSIRKMQPIRVEVKQNPNGKLDLVRIIGIMKTSGGRRRRTLSKRVKRRTPSKRVKRRTPSKSVKRRRM
jgi:hypothetical protein